MKTLRTLSTDIREARSTKGKNRRYVAELKHLSSKLARRIAKMELSHE